MKRVLLVSLVILLSFANTFADGRSDTRSKCKHGYQYKTKARTACVTYAYSQSVETCNQTQINAYSSTAVSGVTKAVQESENGPSGAHFRGKVYARVCSRGTLSDFVYDQQNMSPMITTSILDSERVDITTGTIEFDSVENTITIPNINGYNRSMFTDYVSSFTITIWEPNDLDPGDDEDSVITETKTKWLAKATLLNGDLSLTNFTETQVSLTNTDSGYVMNLNDFTKVIEFPETTLVNNLIVTIETHGEEDAASLMQAVSVRTDEMQKKGLISFNVYPNPSTDNISIKFKDKQIKDFKACVYDISGHRILNFDSGSMSNNTGDEVTLKINISTLPKGTYFISIQNNGKGYIQKIVKK